MYHFKGHLRDTIYLLDQDIIFYFKEHFIHIIYLFVIFHFIIYRHYVTQRQNTFFFDMKCTYM